MKSLVFALLIIVFWGFWGFFAKLGLQKVSWQVFLFISYIISLIIITPFVVNKIELRYDVSTWIFIILSSVAVTLGSLFFYRLLETEKLGIAVPLTALYPAVAIILGVLFLNETLNLKQIIGVIFALISILLLSL